MFERFTDRARQTILEAQTEAIEQHLNYIGTEHLLLGLLRVGSGVAHEALPAEGVEVEVLREKVTPASARWPPGSRGGEQGRRARRHRHRLRPSRRASRRRSVPARCRTSARCRRSRRRPRRPSTARLRRAQMLRHRHVGTEHVLFGLLDDRETFAAWPSATPASTWIASSRRSESRSRRPRFGSRPRGRRSRAAARAGRLPAAQQDAAVPVLAALAGPRAARSRRADRGRPARRRRPPPPSRRRWKRPPPNSDGCPAHEPAAPARRARGRSSRRSADEHGRRAVADDLQGHAAERAAVDAAAPVRAHGQHGVAAGSP